MNLDKFYIEGFQVFENILSAEENKILKEKLKKVYEIQKKEFGEDKLKQIGEDNMVRSPFLYDSYFINLITKPIVLEIVDKIIGEHAILSLQNSIIIPPNQTHHQSFYHRDIIHQDFTSSIPLSINIYYALDNYDLDNGGTCFIPESHKMDKMPKNYVENTPEVKSGSIILFDSMIYHKAGINKTDNYRYGINHMFTLPFLKQQIDYPYALGGKYYNEFPINKILGYSSREYKSVVNFREERYKRIIK